MNPQAQNLIKAERKQSDFSFITEVIQKGRIKPAKFNHSLELPEELYIEMREAGVIIPETFFVDETAFFEFRHGKVIMSFRQMFIIDDVHLRIDNYLIRKAYGENPIRRNAQSKMNQDITVVPVQHVIGKKLKKQIA